MLRKIKLEDYFIFALLLLSLYLIIYKLIHYIFLYEVQVKQMKIIYGYNDPDLLTREEEVTTLISNYLIVLVAQVLILIFYLYKIYKTNNINES